MTVMDNIQCWPYHAIEVDLFVYAAIYRNRYLHTGLKYRARW